MNVAELLQRIALGEDASVELKEIDVAGSRVTAPRRESLADELAALANARGGLCVLGIEDGTRAIMGIPRAELDLVEAYVREICNDSIEPPLVAHI